MSFVLQAIYVIQKRFVEEAFIILLVSLSHDKRSLVVSLFVVPVDLIIPKKSCFVSTNTIPFAQHYCDVGLCTKSERSSRRTYQNRER